MSIPKLKIRGFMVAAGWEQYDVKLPLPGTAHSAGYDFFSPVDVSIPVQALNSPPFLVPTGVKAYMKGGELLMLANRSSNPKRGLLLANGVGIIDQDFFGNVDNDGHIQFAYWNTSAEPVLLSRGDKIGQGIFLNYLGADEARSDVKRKGGFGSTDS